MFPTINLGYFVFPTAGLLYIFGAYLCLTVIEKAAVSLKLSPQKIYAVGAMGLLSGVVGARLVFVVEFWAAFRESLLSIVWPLNTGYTPVAGLLIGITAVIFYGRAKQMPVGSTLDALIPGIIIGLMVISLADFAAGPGYGLITAVPWSVSQFGIRRHPVQIYEILVGVAALALWWKLTPKRTYSGQLFLACTAVYGAGRLFVEAFRANALLTADGYHIVQMVSLLLLLTSLFLLGFLSEKQLTQQVK